MSRTSLSIVDCSYAAPRDELFPDKPIGIFSIPGRAYHACVQYKQYMCIHGGEISTHDNMKLGEDGAPTPVVVPVQAAVDGGVCPGDSLAALSKYNKTFPKTQSQSQLNLLQTRCAAPGLKCMDDFFIFNCETSAWKPVKSVLSPLPRKGHTLDIITLDNVKYFVLFGGFSTDSSLLSNSLHICNVEDAVSGRGAVWKHLDCCDGDAPSPRYFHSCCVVTKPGGRLGKRVHEALCVFGGIGATSEILSDFYFLNLHTFKWTRVDPVMVPGLNGNAGQIAPKPLFGHTAVACSDSSSIPTNPYTGASKTSSLGDKPKRLKFGNVLIFGGKTLRRDQNATSEDPALETSAGTGTGTGTGQQKTGGLAHGTSTSIDEESNCSNFSYRFSFKDLSWTIASSGHMVPQPRYGHAICVVKGLTPIHNFPTTLAAAKALQNGSTPLIANDDGVLVSTQPISSMIPTTNKNNTEDDDDDDDGTPMLFRQAPEVSSAVLVGGLNSSMVPGDFWVLDTKFRRAGMEQYDKNYYPPNVPSQARFTREVLQERERQRSASAASGLSFNIGGRKEVAESRSSNQLMLVQRGECNENNNIHDLKTSQSAAVCVGNPTKNTNSNKNTISSKKIPNPNGRVCEELYEYIGMSEGDIARSKSTPIIGSSSRAYADTTAPQSPRAHAQTNKLPQIGERLVVGLPSASADIGDIDDQGDIIMAGETASYGDPDALPAVTTIDGDGNEYSGHQLDDNVGDHVGDNASRAPVPASVPCGPSRSFAASHTSSVADAPARLDQYDDGNDATDPRVAVLISCLRKECSEYSKQLLSERHDFRVHEAASEAKIAELVDILAIRDAELAASKAESAEYRKAYTLLVEHERELASNLEEAYSLLMLEKITQNN